MVLSRVFRETPAVQQTADYPDYTTGSFYKIFYLLGTRDSSDNPSYLLIDNNLISSNSVQIFTTGTHSGDLDETKVIDIDFDILITRPMVIDGRVYFSFSWALENNSVNDDIHGHFEIVLKRFDGSTETILGTAETATLTNGVDQDRERRTVLDLDITDAKVQGGDILRITVEGYLQNDNSSGTSNIFIAHDPQNSDISGSAVWTAISESTFQAHIPIKPTF